ncbi:MAG TPA: protein kinase [Steroidobacteraceae bacterium]|nr:protein kinase [Steroidobacteraceae bacterium]
MPEKPGVVVESLIAELRDGQGMPDAIPPGLKDLGMWDAESLDQLLQELHAYNRAGRLSDQELDALCLMLDRSSSDTPGDDLDATVELEVPTPPAAQPARPDRPAQQVELRRGSVLRDRYVLGDAVGSGGMSVVFRARDLRRDPGEAGDPSEIAIKVLRQEMRASGPANARLKREFRQSQALRHPGIVRMFDLDCDGDIWFITMELLLGTSLDARLRQLPAVPIAMAEAMRIATACADVLAFAHRQGALHGDFKPGNVFLEDGGTVKVLDFGTAPGSPQTAVDVAADRGPIPRAATRAYASPEVLAGEAAEPRDDVFSLAAVVYELLSGRHPFGRLAANKARDLSLAVTPLPQLSSAQNAALASALAWARAGRPATVQEFMRLLTAFAIEPLPPVEPWLPRKDPLPWPWIGVLVATTVLLVALWPIITGRDRDAGTLPGDGTAAVSRPAPTVAAPGATPPPTLASPSAEEPPAPSAAPLQAVLQDEEPPVRSATVAPALPARPPAPVAARERTQVGADSASIVVSEGTHAAVILLRREGNLAVSAQVAWRLANGSARVQEDFDEPATGTTRFLPGQTTRAVYVPLINDALAEGEEFFSLRLSSRSAAIGPTGDVTITIVDDDQ